MEMAATMNEARVTRYWQDILWVVKSLFVGCAVIPTPKSFLRMMWRMMIMMMMMIKKMS